MANVANELQAVIEDIKDKSFKTAPHLLTNIPTDIPYVSNCCHGTRTSLKNNQRKLFNALLIFLTKYASDGDTVVYLGSAPGYNIGAVAELFPTINFELYDPKRTHVSDARNINIIRKNPRSLDGTKFTKDDAKRYFQNKDTTLFFSDIRTTDSKNTVTEQVVASDLELQLQLVKIMLPKAFCLKFRVPFVNAKGETTHSLKYCSGFPYIQPYSPNTTTEVRLMNTSELAFGSKSEEITWTLEEHENRMFYINTVLREWAYYETIPVNNGDNCFDCSLEEVYCCAYIKSIFNTRWTPSGTSIETCVRDMRNWIDAYNVKMSLNPPTDPKFGGVLSEVKHLLSTDPSVISHHGHLPLRNRLVSKVIAFLDPVDVYARIILDRGGLSKEYKQGGIYHDEFIEKLTAHSDLINSSVTHKSISSTANYEKLEFLGDRILSECISLFFYRFSTTNEISVLNGLQSAFTSGETATSLFAKTLALRDVVRINDEANVEKALEDVFEAIMAGIFLFFDSAYGDMVGNKICYNIIESILGTIDFSNYYNNIFPPKTELKELFDADRQRDGWDFDSQYSVTVGGTKLKKGELDEWSSDLITVRLALPPAFASITPPPYEEYGPKRHVEKNAAIAFLEFFRNRGILPKPKLRDLGLVMRIP